MDEYTDRIDVNDVQKPVVAKGSLKELAKGIIPFMKKQFSGGRVPEHEEALRTSQELGEGVFDTFTRENKYAKNVSPDDANSITGELGIAAHQTANPVIRALRKVGIMKPLAAQEKRQTEGQKSSITQRYNNSKWSDLTNKESDKSKIAMDQAFKGLGINLEEKKPKKRKPRKGS